MASHIGGKYRIQVQNFSYFFSNDDYTASMHFYIGCNKSWIFADQYNSLNRDSPGGCGTFQESLSSLFRYIPVTVAAFCCGCNIHSCVKYFSPEGMPCLQRAFHACRNSEETYPCSLQGRDAPPANRLWLFYATYVQISLFFNVRCLLNLISPKGSGACV